MRAWILPTLAALSAAALPTTAHAQFRFHLDGHASAPMSRPQTDEFGLGGGGGLAFEWAPLAHLGLLARVQGLALSAYHGALPQGYAYPGTGTLEALTVGARFRPLGWSLGSRSDGLWFEIDGGGGFTGSSLRPVVGARAGVAFGIGAFALGPYVGYTRVFEVGSTILPGDAQIGSVGLELTYSMATARTQTAPPPPPRPAAPPPRVCPALARVASGDFDRDGCPDGDRDGDGIADLRDRCPDVGEDLDGFEDTDGCPDPDNDHDGIGDVFDACPSVPETVNGVDDEDGCPDEAPVQVVQGRIQVSEAIHFGFNSAHVLRESYGIVRAVAQVLRTHPEYATCFVEGHADEIGPEVYNYNLSYQRARYVIDLLVEFGIARSRLVPMGFGRSSPVDPARTPGARAQNRRVEFVVNGHRSTGRARTEQGYMNVHDEEPAR